MQRVVDIVILLHFWLLICTKTVLSVVTGALSVLGMKCVRGNCVSSSIILSPLLDIFSLLLLCSLLTSIQSSCNIIAIPVVFKLVGLVVLYVLIYYHSHKLLIFTALYPKYC